MLASYPAVALLASLGALILERVIVFSGGGPPLGKPLITMDSPEITCKCQTKYLHLKQVS